jgi:tellurite methyltransferase
MSLWTNWNEYFELTKGQPPRKILTRAVPLVANKESALDLGSGALNDTLYLLAEGFEHVTAVDKEPVAEVVAKTLPADRFSYVISKMEDFVYPPNTFDLVNAQFSLPFIKPEHFDEVWERIDASLKPGGIFVGQLFGDRDGWVGNDNMTFHTKSQAERLCGNFNTLVFEEEEKDKPTAAGHPKHWHIFHFILRK